jgi:hypothetical protein
MDELDTTTKNNSQECFNCQAEHLPNTSQLAKFEDLTKVEDLKIQGLKSYVIWSMVPGILKDHSVFTVKVKQ